MPQIHATNLIAPTRNTTSSSGANPLNASLDKALNTMPWSQARIWEGRGYHVTVGAQSTPIVGGGNGTIIDPEQSECSISIPTGTTLIPVRFHIQIQRALAATDADEAEIFIMVDRTAVSTASGSTGTVETVFNMRTDLGSTGSLCTVVSANTSDHATPTFGIELAGSHDVADLNGSPANAMWDHQELLYEPLTPPLIVGPAAVYVYWAGTVATPGFAQLQWIEVPTPPTS